MSVLCCCYYLNVVHSSSSSRGCSVDIDSRGDGVILFTILIGSHAPYPFLFYEVSKGQLIKAKLVTCTIIKIRFIRFIAACAEGIRSIA